jgi:SSS family solute:Na+ symporter
MVSAQGGGIAFNGLTNGLISYEIGALLVIIVVIAYVSIGRQRGTGWTNVVQGVVFLLLLLVTVIWIPFEIGGFSQATNAVAQASEAHLMRGDNPMFQPRPWFSVMVLLTLGVIMYPHMFVRFMTAKSHKAIKNTSMLYPFALIVAWIPATLVGFWGAGQLQDLPNPDFVFPAMVAEFLPIWVMGLALAGVLAALMSSIDGQVLTLSTLFSENIVHEFLDFDDRQEVWATRVFIFLLLALAYAGALTTQETIIQNALFFISGYAATFIPVVSALYLERVNKQAVTSGLVLGFAGMWAFNLGWLPPSLSFGFLPIVPVLIAQIVVMAVVILATSPAPEERTAQYRSLLENIW